MFDTKTARRRLRVVGLTTSQADQLVTLVQKWIQCSGEEWTVERLKSIKVDLLRHYAGLPPLKTHSWIRYRSGVPKGPFRPLFILSRKRFRTAWNAMMVYTGIVYTDPSVRCTAKQWEKMVGAIQRQPLQTADLQDGLALVHESPFYVSIEISSDTGVSLMDYNPSPSRRAPKGFVTVPEVEGVYDSIRPLLQRSIWTAMNWDILSGTLAGVDKPIQQILEINLRDEERSSGVIVERPLMGNIALIQEGGYKLRFAANPYRVYQQALQPLGRALFRALKRVPNDFTFDQAAAIPLIQKWLSEGFPACSMDLSNCSDNLPLDMQLELLSRFGVSTRWLQFFRDTCRGDWYVKRTAYPTVLKWTVGSPLGLYPTFASFALLHHSIVQWCFHKLGKPKIVCRHSTGEEVLMYPYVIVGDDFTVMDNDVAMLYQRIMAKLGVPISEHKTLWSKDTAEFIGRIITSNSVTQGFKWKGRMSDDNFVDFCRNFGPGALTLLNARQKRVISYIADLPEPYGLGWNPFGIPLDERLTPALERVWSRPDERVRTFYRRAERVHRLLYMSEDGRGPLPKGVSPEEWGLDADTLSSDQEDEDLSRLLIPGLESLGVAIWPNFPAIVAARSLPMGVQTNYDDMLRRTSYVETRKEATALVVLERKVRRSLAL